MAEHGISAPWAGDIATSLFTTVAKWVKVPASAFAKTEWYINENAVQQLAEMLNRSTSMGEIITVETRTTLDRLVIGAIVESVEPGLIRLRLPPSAVVTKQPATTSLDAKAKKETSNA